MTDSFTTDAFLTPRHPTDIINMCWWRLLVSEQYGHDEIGLPPRAIVPVEELAQEVEAVELVQEPVRRGDQVLLLTQSTGEEEEGLSGLDGYLFETDDLSRQTTFRTDAFQDNTQPSIRVLAPCPPPP